MCLQCPVSGSGFRVSGLGLWEQQGLGFRVYGNRVEASDCDKRRGRRRCSRKEQQEKTTQSCPGASQVAVLLGVQDFWGLGLRVSNQGSKG